MIIFIISYFIKTFRINISFKLNYYNVQFKNEYKEYYCEVKVLIRNVINLIQYYFILSFIIYLF